MRKRLGLTQRQLAAALPCEQGRRAPSHQWVSEMERDQRPVPRWVAEEILLLDPALDEPGHADEEVMRLRRRASGVGAKRGPYRRVE